MRRRAPGAPRADARASAASAATDASSSWTQRGDGRERSGAAQAGEQGQRGPPALRVGVLEGGEERLLGGAPAATTPAKTGPQLLDRDRPGERGPRLGRAGEAGHQRGGGLGTTGDEPGDAGRRGPSEPRWLAASASTSEGRSSARPLASASAAGITSYSPRSTSTENGSGSGSTRAGSTTLPGLARRAAAVRAARGGSSPPAPRRRLGAARDARMASAAGGGPESVVRERLRLLHGLGRGLRRGRGAGGGRPSALRARIIRASASPSAARSGKRSARWPEATGASSLSA